MKQNGYSIKKGKYYIGIDAGTSSVGWAATDPTYHMLKHKGKALWGARLFDEAATADERRMHRTARRRLQRQKQRIALLEMMFADELNRIDPLFLERMHESALWLEDKKTGCKYSLFNDPDYTDREYHKNYPTIYHLRKSIIEDDQEFDIRLIYLALHHLMKTRGHFLYDSFGDSDEILTVEQALADLKDMLETDYALDIAEALWADLCVCLLETEKGIKDKKTALKKLLGKKSSGADEIIHLQSVFELMIGSTVNLDKLFLDDSLKDAEISKVCFHAAYEENIDKLSEVLDDRMMIVEKAKIVFDTIRLTRLIGEHQYLCEAKVALYEQNAKDLRSLKAYVRKTSPEQYKTIFCKQEAEDNYAAYSRYEHNSGEHTCTQEQFCVYLKKMIKAPTESSSESIKMIYQQIEDKSFLPKLRSSENGVIPYQLQRKELLAILEKASSYLPFLNETDPDGLTLCEKVEKLFSFRVPYYVGPIGGSHPNHWAVRFAGCEKEKALPWNFEKVIDLEESAEGFMHKLIGNCTYTGDKVLPLNSLMYSEYVLLNEINPLKVNDKPLPNAVKRRLLEDLFFSETAPKGKVTKKSILQYLVNNGEAGKTDRISGIDDTIKADIKSHRDFRRILDRTGDYGMVEQIIRAILVLGADKKMLRSWLKKHTHDLDESDYRYICRLNYSGWGSLSETFLYRLQSGKSGKTIMELLWETDQNLMQLLHSEHQFLNLAEEYRRERYGSGETLREKLDAFYIAPAVRRSIRQTLRIVDEIVDTQKCAPEKIFVEMARDTEYAKQQKKGKRTKTRKEMLTELYKSCENEYSELFHALQGESDERLQSDDLFLYYTQFGKCMYSGKAIRLEDLKAGHYDKDHIFPKSKIKDDSIENRVLVCAELNRDKTNEYPIKRETREAMLPFWTMLHKKKLIGDKKYGRLIRSTPLTEAELSEFVARQLVETQQATKALTKLLKERYPESRIVYSKAGNVSDFRRKFKMLKCRSVNDFHHAQDAYLNIVVGNVYDTKFTEQFFRNITHENYSLNAVFERDVAGAWDTKTTIGLVKKQIRRSNQLITWMPREVKGQLFDLQLVPAGKGQVPKKSGMEIEKYGGYNKQTGSFYCAVEYQEKSKRIRALAPVYLAHVHEFEAAPLDYCRNVLQMEDPIIICKRIPVNSVLEIDGKRFLIASRTGGNIVMKHTYQLVLSYEQQNYIRNLEKYVRRCMEYRSELPVTEHDKISKEENIDLYKQFIQKCETTAYSSFLHNVRNDLLTHEMVFLNMSILEQAKLLMEILKGFQCNTVYPNFETLCGKKLVGRIQRSMKFTSDTSVKLIHQSVTGVYETPVDLLE